MLHSADYCNSGCSFYKAGQGFPALSAVFAARPAVRLGAPPLSAPAKQAATVWHGYCYDVIALRQCERNPMTQSEHDQPRQDEQPLMELMHQHLGLRVSLYCVATLAVLYALYSARSLLLPIAVALFFSLLLSPLVSGLKRLHVPRSLSSVLLLCLLGGPFVVLTIELAEPAQKWLEKLPELTETVTEGLTDISESLSPEAPKPVEPVPERETGFSFSKFFGGEDEQVEPEPEPPPDSALVESVKKGGIDIVLSMLGVAPFILAQCAIWLILLLFLLIYGPGLYDNCINLLPMIRNKRRAMLLVGRLRQELSRYILTVTVINATLGFVTGSVLWLLGVEDAVLWGAMVGLLNYAPYVGTFISISILSIAGVIQYGVELAALLPAAIFFGLNTLESQFVTPTVLGQNMRLNPLILILWLLIWGWLWGPVGVLIAVPLLVCLKLVATQLNVMTYWVALVETKS